MSELDIYEILNQESAALQRWSDGRWIVAWGAPLAQAEPDSEKPSFFVNDFFLRDEKPWRVFPETRVLPNWPVEGPALAPSSRSWRWPDRNSFGASFASIQEAISQGDLEKAVPVSFAHSDSPLKSAERRRALWGLGQSGGELRPYAYSQGGRGFMGATPEVLFRIEKNNLFGMALAGTRSSGSGQSLLEDSKELHEHNLVLTDLVRRTKKLGKTEIGETHEWDIGILTHLCTSVRVQLRQAYKINELICRLHPTPALGIYSAHLDWHWLEDLPEQSTRWTSGAPFGVHWPGQGTEILVAIRQVQWQKNSLRLGVGCGIVEQSDEEREWQELKNKARATATIMGWEI